MDKKRQVVSRFEMGERLCWRWAWVGLFSLYYVYVWIIPSPKKWDSPVLKATGGGRILGSLTGSTNGHGEGYFWIKPPFLYVLSLHCRYCNEAITKMSEELCLKYTYRRWLTLCYIQKLSPKCTTGATLGTLCHSHRTCSTKSVSPTNTRECKGPPKSTVCNSARVPYTTWHNMRVSMALCSKYTYHSEQQLTSVFHKHRPAPTCGMNTVRLTKDAVQLNKGVAGWHPVPTYFAHSLTYRSFKLNSIVATGSTYVHSMFHLLANLLEFTVISGCVHTCWDLCPTRATPTAGVPGVHAPACISSSTCCIAHVQILHPHIHPHTHKSSVWIVSKWDFPRKLHDNVWSPV